jgi:isoquinoline 1-oxidoreductase beta subunit
VNRKFTSPASPSRRDMMKASAVLGGGFVFGFHVPFDALANSASPSEINAWVVVNADDSCVIRFARTEMGQGTLTGLAQLVAEELSCDWNKVQIERVSPQENLARKNAWGQMLTVGSFGIRFSHDYVRRGGAAARMALLQAAANQLQVPVDQLTVKNGIITHAASGRSLSYGKVANDAAKLPPIDFKTVALKDPKDWTLIGKSVPRLDTKDKLDGSKIYAVDVKLPGMLNAIYIAAPVFGSKIREFDASQAKTMPGVKNVYTINDEAFTVVADTWWRAKKASEKVKVIWDDSLNGLRSNSTISAYLKDRTCINQGVFEFRKEGDAKNAINQSAKRDRGGIQCAIFSTRYDGTHELCRISYTRSR